MSELDPAAVTLDEWLRDRGTYTGHQTIHGHTYCDLVEVEWRQANNRWEPARRLCADHQDDQS